MSNRRGRLWSAQRFVGVGVSAGLHGLIVVALCVAPRSGAQPQGAAIEVQLVGPAALSSAPAPVQQPTGANPRRASLRTPSPDPAPAPSPAVTVAGADGVRAASAATTEAVGGAGEVELHYQDELLAHIGRFRAYPDAARPNRLVGRVLVSFVMTREGRVLDIWVDRSSGQPLLDTAAKETVLRAQPLPPIPAALPSVLTLSLPVDFSLSGPA